MLGQGKLLRNVLIMNMDTQLENISASMYGKEISALNAEQIYIVVVCMVKGLVDTFIRSVGEKTFYYISTAFEKGQFLENNLINLGIYEILEGVLVSKGQEMSTLKRVEEEYMGKHNSFEQTSQNFFIESKKNGLPAEAMGIRMRYHKYPKIYEVMKERHNTYNETMEYIRRLEKEGKAFVIQPKVKSNVGRLEKDEEKMQDLYDDGYRDAKECFERLMTFLNS